MTRITAAIIIVAIIIVGAIEKIYKLYTLTNRLEFTSRYRNDFIDFCNQARKTHHLEDDRYYSLLQDVNKIQRELGMDGIISVYQDPLAGFQMNNYPLFLNFFNEMRQYMTSYSLFEERVYLLVSSCDEALVKHIGNLKEAIALGKSKVKNPFFCFANGISFISSLPIRVLEWCGIINNKFSTKILNSKFQTIINKIAILLGLISSLFTIILGWDNFIMIIKKLIN